MFFFSNRLVIVVVCFISFTEVVCANPRLEPYEPYNPAKAQRLQASSGKIIVGSNSYEFSFEVADNNYSRALGLMHRSEMGQDSGMLFDFKSDLVVNMWMRNTFLPLDILFISEAGNIITIIKGAEPHSERPISSKTPVRAALELVAGTIDRLNIEVGNKISHSIFK